MQTPLPADAGPIWQIEPVNRLDWFLQHRNHFYMFCHWVGAECLGKIIFVQLESGDCSDFSFCADYCCLADCLEKNDFWVGKIIFWWNWTSGDCWICPFLCLLLPGRLTATLQFHKNDFPYPKITSFRAVCLCLSLLLWMFCQCLVCLLFWSVPQPAAGVKNKMNTTWRMA